MDRAESINLLNKAVGGELQTIHQYMYFHFHLADQGFGPLATLFKQVAVQEMGHLEMLAERILFLKGELEMVAAGPVENIVEPEPILVHAMAMEEHCILGYNQSALECGAKADSGSKQLFEQLVKAEEGHFDLFEKQCDHIKRFGPSYLALESFGRGSSAVTT